MARREDEFNRYGERDVRPGHFQHGGGIGHLFHGEQHPGEISLTGYQDELGMNRDENEEPLRWTGDPRSESSSEDHSGKGPRGWLTDEKLKALADEELYLSYLVDASEIEVTCQDAVLILKGTVRDRDQKRYAEQVIERIRGVRDVRNELTIRKG